MAEQPELDLLAKWEAERAELDVMIAGLRRRLGMAVSGGSETGSPGVPGSAGAGGEGDTYIGGDGIDIAFFHLCNAENVQNYLTVLKPARIATASAEVIRKGGVVAKTTNGAAAISIELDRAEERVGVGNPVTGC